jgi:hypothetical protein
LLESPTSQAEKNHPDDISLAGDGFDTVIKAKAAIDNDSQCRNKVSCADILALATRDVVNLVYAYHFDFPIEVTNKISIKIYNLILAMKHRHILNQTYFGVKHMLVSIINTTQTHIIVTVNYVNSISIVSVLHKISAKLYDYMNANINNLIIA